MKESFRSKSLDKTLVEVHINDLIVQNASVLEKSSSNLICSINSMRTLLHSTQNNDLTTKPIP